MCAQGILQVTEGITILTLRALNTNSSCAARVSFSSLCPVETLVRTRYVAALDQLWLQKSWVCCCLLFLLRSFDSHTYKNVQYCPQLPS